MGIAKTMHAIGVYHFYTNDYVAFAKEIGKRVKANIEVRFEDYTINDEMLNKGREVFDNGYKEVLQLNVITDFYNYENPTEGAYIYYVLILPIDLVYQDELCLEFSPNGIFQLYFLPFSSSWSSFINDLKNKTNSLYPAQSDSILKNINRIRSAYINLLQKINSNEIIIWTDYFYQTEEKYLHSQHFTSQISLVELKTAMVELDKLQLFDFMQVVNQEIKIDSTIYSDFQIAFIDKF